MFLPFSVPITQHSTISIAKSSVAVPEPEPEPWFVTTAPAPGGKLIMAPLAPALQHSCY